MSGSKNRLNLLVASTTLNGIDFVEVVDGSDQKTLRVHFLSSTKINVQPISASVIGGDTIPTVKIGVITPGDWSEDPEGRPLLDLHTERAGDFSFYTLALTNSMLDPYYSTSKFTFKATCPSDLDCQPPAAVCLPGASEAPPIDYLAKDFASFRKALLEFSALRYPDWRERSEADFGVMFAELLSAQADELSYYQDRIAAEATIETATERRSLTRLARLVDYEPRPATSSETLVQFTMPIGVVGPIPPGLVISANGPDGTDLDFETGTGLSDLETYPVDIRWNPGALQPYWWDDSQQCLRAGSTEAWILGTGYGFAVGQALVIETVTPDSGEPPLREVIHLKPSRANLADFADKEFDPVFVDHGNPTAVTHIRWGSEESLRHDHDLSITTFGANVVPATQGRRRTETFAIESVPPGISGATVAVRRTGPRAPGAPPALVDRYPLHDGPLAWLASPSNPAADPVPEIALLQMPTPPDYRPLPWSWRRSLLDCEVFDNGFTVDPAAYRVIARRADRSPVFDYDGDSGESIRFGDGIFGERPDSQSVFQVTYRVAAGRTGNVAADAINRVQDRPGFTGVSVRNVVPATGGQDPEPAEVVRRLAPERFRAEQLRAVLPSDYVSAAKTLSWVAAAGADVRWTGSWLTIFASADPRGSELESSVQRLGLIRLLNRYRMAGTEVYSPLPRFASLDLVLTACAGSDAFAATVEAALVKALGTGNLESGMPAFFAPNQFSFGMPLERSRLEAAAQAVDGVAGVLSIQYRQRGLMAQAAELRSELQVGTDQIIRVDNDPDHPDRGILTVHVEGGR